jgi:hypothetical protein
LRDDYLKYEYFHDLSIIINLSVNSAMNYSQANADEKRVTDQLLPLVSRATIAVGNDATGELDEHLWFNIFLLSKALASRAPRLTTIKVTATEIANRLSTALSRMRYARNSAIARSSFCRRMSHSSDSLCVRMKRMVVTAIANRLHVMSWIWLIVELLSRNQYPCVSAMCGPAHGYLQG